MGPVIALIIVMNITVWGGVWLYTTFQSILLMIPWLFIAWIAIVLCIDEMYLNKDMKRIRRESAEADLIDDMIDGTVPCDPQTRISLYNKRKAKRKAEWEISVRGQGPEDFINLYEHYKEDVHRDLYKGDE